MRPRPAGSDASGASRDAPPDADPDPHRGDGVDVLERAVGRLQREVEGLRTALRYRAVIEQAKGVLVSRLGVEPDVAFRRLVERSQQHNRKLTAIAAGVVAHALAHPEDRDAIVDDAADEDVRIHLAAAAFAAAPDVAELTETTVAELADLGVRGAALFASEPGHALRLLHHVGLRGSATGWERISLMADLPVTEAARSGRMVLLRDRVTQLREHPGTRLIPATGEASASVPLFHGHQFVGVLFLLWEAPFDADDAATARLRGTAERLAPRLVALLTRHQEDLVGRHLEPGYDGWFHRFLDTVPVPVTLFEPVREDGQVVDLVVVYANTSSGLGPGPEGRGVLERWPQVARTDLFDQVRHVLGSGVPWTTPTFELPGCSERRGLVLADLTVGRLGSLVAMTCRSVGPVAGQPARSKR